MQYFRYYTKLRQLTYFLLLVFTFFLVANILLNGVMFKAWGISLAQIEGMNDKSPLSLIRAAQIVQGISSLLVFFLPGFVFAYLAHPRPMQYLGLVKPGKNVQFVLVLLAMLGAMPVLQLLEGVIGKIDFGPAVRKTQEANDNMMSAMLTMPDFWAFLRAFLVMAIIPGLGEEVFFRGVMMRFARVNGRKMIFPIMFTGLVFAMAHSNVYGYLSIFLAGSLLGGIYYLTGSLWCSILAHVFFNGFQVILTYLAVRIPSLKAFTDSAGVAQIIPWAIGGAVVFSVSFYLLWKHKTPFPENWPVDFTNDELKQGAAADNV